MPAGRLPAYAGHNPLGRMAVTLFLVLLHVAGVIHGELRQGGSLVSAMITGRKTFRDPPVDTGADSQ